MTGKRELVREKKPKLWLIPTVAAAALVSAYAGFCVAAAATDTINPNTGVGGIEIGGMTRAEAAQAIAPRLNALRIGSGVHTLLEDGEEAAFLTYDELGVTFDAAALADEAFDAGHSGDPFSDGWELICSALGKYTVVTPKPDPGWEAVAAPKLAEASALNAKDFSYIPGTSSLTLIKARNGRDVNTAMLEQRLGGAEADMTGSRSVELPYAPVIADQGDLKALNEALGGEMANARYDAETESIVPERPALNFDVAQAQMMLDAAAPGAEVTVPAVASTPTVTAAELEKVLFRDVLGTYTTRVGGAAGRKANVRLTAERVNGTVLNSGEEFNYYTLTGPFSKANGYQSAPGYFQGKTVEMDGGGACQCSSTTYAAALLANLEIVTRTAHGFASDYIGLGLDATVSGDGPEFIFRNNTPYPIKIEAIYSDKNRLTVNILGTKTDETTVKIRTELLSTTPYEDEYQENEEIAPGEQRVEQTPYTGYLVNTYRQIYDGQGKLISETFEARSKYNKRNRITLVAPGELPGAEPPEAPPADTPPETPTDPMPTDLPGGVQPVPVNDQIEGLGGEEGGNG